MCAETEYNNQLGCRETILGDHYIFILHLVKTQWGPWMTAVMGRGQVPTPRFSLALILGVRCAFLETELNGSLSDPDIFFLHLNKENMVGPDRRGSF